MERGRPLENAITQIITTSSYDGLYFKSPKLLPSLLRVKDAPVLLETPGQLLTLRDESDIGTVLFVERGLSFSEMTAWDEPTMVASWRVNGSEIVYEGVPDPFMFSGSCSAYGPRMGTTIVSQA
ncbi:hypothetical protein J3458_009233 [Metarhizium acridum]|uniref:uncharacterized protein n=1 Tax=Metarhizium acridum TaxID=92637 RepID=UPI001C6ACE89|nr:hypothetical protein J3458_009233 [Metarhizium acridum]